MSWVHEIKISCIRSTSLKLKAVEPEWRGSFFKDFHPAELPFSLQGCLSSNQYLRAPSPSKGRTGWPESSFWKWDISLFSKFLWQLTTAVHTIWEWTDLARKSWLILQFWRMVSTLRNARNVPGKQNAREGSITSRCSGKWDRTLETEEINAKWESCLTKRTSWNSSVLNLFCCLLHL